ncbi:aminoacyl-tRNA hydrolase [Paludisphaera mucosa]|uniref:Peptidyl-tRNA hydrolase n=1 Tax=Paludisphaera mucosa TaxID=3030827 RepID=A0ABT6FGV6_9BACT|nr:aminoacyl-tRNA hydrolase [Paludisphaera mucosa]MDG3006716.1 aminoacyl-tRNA hydrolase [Paludisphaera mucosa]
MATLKLVVGLGNPGPKYHGTRHNIGFDLVDRLAAGARVDAFARKFEGLLAEVEIEYRRVLLLKPDTFMNLSGRSVGQAVRFHKIDLADVLVVCDDLNLPVGKLRFRKGGSDGGQKGLRDVAAHLGTHEFPRLRIGIGEAGEGQAVDYVLGRFKGAEKARIDDALILASQAVAVWAVQGGQAVMNRFNGPSPQ